MSLTYSDTHTKDLHGSREEKRHRGDGVKSVPQSEKNRGLTWYWERDGGPREECVTCSKALRFPCINPIYSLDLFKYKEIRLVRISNKISYIP